MKTAVYSKVIAEVIRGCLENEEWNYSFNEENGTFDLGLHMQGKLSRIFYVIDVGEDKFTVYGIAPISVDIRDSVVLAKMAEFICRVNYGLCNGNFELDFRDGEIRYKSFVDCEDQIPVQEIIKNSIHCTAATNRTDRL